MRVHRRVAVSGWGGHVLPLSISGDVSGGRGRFSGAAYQQQPELPPFRPEADINFAGRLPFHRRFRSRRLKVAEAQGGRKGDLRLSK